jgi:hypothetical protein
MSKVIVDGFSRSTDLLGSGDLDEDTSGGLPMSFAMPLPRRTACASPPCVRMRDRDPRNADNRGPRPLRSS